MAERQPFVLLDDARETGAADALLFENPRRVFVAHRPEQVARALADADDARREGGELAGYIAYEAGLALEDRLADRAAVRSGGAGPLVWLGLLFGTRWSSVGGMSAGISAPIAMWAFDRVDLVPVSLAMALILLWRHRQNIARLTRGEEPKVGKSKTAMPE